MNGGHKPGKTPERQKIVSILKAKRLPYSERPAIEPPCVVKALTADIPERDKYVIAEADIGADMRLGDLNLTALRKCRYILENAPYAFKDQHYLELMLSRTIRLIAEYGEPEGVPLLHLALGMYLDTPLVREEVSKAVSQIGGAGSLSLLLRLLAVDAATPGAHLRSISHFTDRFPEQAGEAIKGLRSFEEDCPAVTGIIEEIRQAASQKR